MNKKLQSEIARRNKLFKGKTRAEKRVLIAKDVLAQIKAQTLIPSSGDWVHVLEKYAVNGEDSLREVILNKDAQCNCCALGGLFLSCTLFNNKVTVGDIDHFGEYGNLAFNISTNRKFSNGLTSIFSTSQLKLIENAFERGYGAFGTSEEENIDETTRKAIAFGDKFDYDDDRMIAIMKNIIKNNGRFVP